MVSHMQWRKIGNFLRNPSKKTKLELRKTRNFQRKILFKYVYSADFLFCFQTYRTSLKHRDPLACVVVDNLILLP